MGHDNNSDCGHFSRGTYKPAPDIRGQFFQFRYWNLDSRVSGLSTKDRLGAHPRNNLCVHNCIFCRNIRHKGLISIANSLPTANSNVFQR